MAIKNLISLKGSLLEITFQSVIDLLSFERILKASYLNSKRKGVARVKFNFHYVTWCDILQLSMISLWILELKNLGKEVDVFYPTNQRFVAFLDNYRFTHFLNENGIASNRSSIGLKFKLLHRPFLPMTFANQDVYKKLLHDLSNNRFYTSLFSEVEYYAVAKKGIIRDIVIKELGDNMYNHGDGRFSNLVVTKISSAPGDKRTEFFVKKDIDVINGKPYVAVVVSDKGPGIYSKMKSSYKKDTILASKKKRPTPADILEYSTFEHATSRPVEERLESLSQLIKAEITDLNPFTGLFHLKQIVKNYQGILTIRSGDSFVVFNYFEKRGELTLYKNDSVKNFKTLANFGGTQIKVVLPILEDYKEIEEKLYGTFKIAEVEDKIKYQYLSLAKYFENSRTEVEILNSCNELVTEIKRSSASDEFNSIILDMRSNHISLDTKIKIVLIYYLMKCQEIDEKVHTIVNIDATLINLMNDSLENKKYNIQRPILVFNTRFQRDIIGVLDVERIMFHQIQRVRIFTDENAELEDFPNKYKSLFVFNKNTETWSIKHSRATIYNTIKENLEGYLREVILDPSSKIFHRDVKVLAPTGHYFDKYFEIYTLFEKISWRERIKQWIEIHLHDSKPSHIVSISQFMGDTVSDLLNETEIISLKKAIFINLASPLDINRKDVAELLFLNNIKSVFFCTDVVATGKTLLSLIENLHSPTICNCCCIVSLLESLNLKSESASINPILIDFIHREPSKSYDSKPSDWKYDEIRTIDIETHKLVLNPSILFQNSPSSLFESPLSQFKLNRYIKDSSKNETLNGEDIEVYENPFFEKVVIPHYAYSLKVISGNKYMPVMYNIPIIIRETEIEIKNDILNCIEKIQEYYSTSITHFVTTGITSNYKPLINLIYREYPDINILNISYNHLDLMTDNLDFSKQGVVVVDDAFISGENYFRILEFCSNRNAGVVLVYILIKRSSEKMAERLKNIKMFGQMRVEFRYLFEGRIPIYSELNNPIIKNISDYETLLNKFEGLPIIEFVKDRIHFFTYKDSSEGTIPLNPIEQYSSNYVRLRWKLEVAISDIGSRKEIASLFELPNENIEEILLLFSILVEEKYTFLFNRPTPDEFFYKKFRINIVNTCVRFLIDKKLLLSASDITNNLEILWALDSQAFSDFINYELVDLLGNKNIVNAIICILCIAPKDYQSLRIKFAFYDIVNNSEPFYEMEETKTILPLLNRIWKNEEAELSRYDLKKAKHIKVLLKSSFHDLSQKVQNLRTYFSADFTDGLSIFGNIVRTVSDASKEITYLFLGGSYEEVRIKLDDKFKQLQDLISYSLGILDALNEVEEKTAFTDNILACAADFTENLFTTDGIIKTLDKEFRTDLKREFANLFIPNLQSSGMSVFINRPRDSCLVFCIKNDFRDILSNIRENILIHSKAENVFIEISKKKSGTDHLIEVRIFDDGKSTDDIPVSHGVNRCISLSKAYSGDFTIGKLDESHPQYENGYRTLAVITLHDLSTDILNLPIYVN